jgi:hypothetical protein
VFGAYRGWLAQVSGSSGVRSVGWQVIRVSTSVRYTHGFRLCCLALAQRLNSTLAVGRPASPPMNNQFLRPIGVDGLCPRNWDAIRTPQSTRLWKYTMSCLPISKWRWFECVWPDGFVFRESAIWCDRCADRCGWFSVVESGYGQFVECVEWWPETGQHHGAKPDESEASGGLPGVH